MADRFHIIFMSDICDSWASSELNAAGSEPTLGRPAVGTALALSGGGYRAMVFHLGTLIRLNELGVLPKLKRISSVSGGSITAGYLGLKWESLKFTDGVALNLMDEVINPVLAFSTKTIDVGSVLGGLFSSGSASDRVSRHYAKELFGSATLQDLPGDDKGPRFIINATNVQTGALWRFSRPYMGDYLVGLVRNPSVSLAVAVGASSAFPPILSPAVLSLDPAQFVPDARCPLQKEPFTSRVVLSDGGVYDNMGVEPVWKRYRTVLVSDAGAKIPPEGKPREDWARHAYRVLDLVDNQVRSLRKRQMVAAFQNPDDDHDGTYWGIRTDIADYGLGDALQCPHGRTLELAAVPTRLKALDATLQQRLVNWGYAVCDAAMRRYVRSLLGENPPSPRFPFPKTLV